MNELTQLERAQKIAADFMPQDKPGVHYVYAYLGKLSYDATKYEIVDDLCLASKRIFHLDESQPDCVGYVGEGSNGRINERCGHPFLPVDIDNRHKLVNALSQRDAKRLERLLIAELGCLLDAKRSGGCLANIQYYYRGPKCCPHLEIFRYRCSKTNHAPAWAASQVTTYAMDEYKSILAVGSMADLGRQFGCTSGYISDCCGGRRNGIWIAELNKVIYFCKADEYHSYCIRPMTKRRILIAVPADGSDICSGTATEISNYVLGTYGFRLHNLHHIAKSTVSHSRGWVARYADEDTDVTPTDMSLNLNAFF